MTQFSAPTSRTSATSPTTVARVAEKVEGFDAWLTDILTANLAQITILQNEESRAAEDDDMRRILRPWVALVAADTVLTGIYGTHF